MVLMCLLWLSTFIKNILKFDGLRVEYKLSHESKHLYVLKQGSK